MSAHLSSIRLGPLVDSDDLTLVAGGPVDAAQLEPILSWLAKRGAGWWRFLEWTHQMRLEEGDPVLPHAHHGLVRGRWFGPAGDLEAWRDGHVVQWRFIGPADARPPGWAHDALADGARLRRGFEAAALLWSPADPRMAVADTRDPDTLGLLRRVSASVRKRATLRYTPFYDHGVVAAVWFQRIERPPKPGGGKELA